MASIPRVGRALGTLAPVLDQFDTENCVQTSSSRYWKLAATTDISLTVEELMASHSFSVERGWKMNQFKITNHLLRSERKKDLIEWIIEVNHRLSTHAWLIA